MQYVKISNRQAQARVADKGGKIVKISSFNPLIISRDAENIIKLFEDMGFE